MEVVVEGGGRSWAGLCDVTGPWSQPLTSRMRILQEAARDDAVIVFFVPLATFPLPPGVEIFRDGSRDVEEG